MTASTCVDRSDGSGGAGGQTVLRLHDGKRQRGTIYTGVTSNPVGRVWQHRTHAIADSFTARYGVTQLVWFEEHGNAEAAITREKRIKEWRRVCKVELIETTNPRWDDLWGEIIG